MIHCPQYCTGISTLIELYCNFRDIFEDDSEELKEIDRPLGEVSWLSSKILNGYIAC